MRRPGGANLLEILAACEHDTPDAVALRFDDYAVLKQAVTEAIVDTFAPVRARYAEFMADPRYLDDVRREGAARACQRAAQTVRRAKRAIGLLP